MSDKKDYSDMVIELGIEKFKFQFNEIEISAETFIKEAGFEETVYCNIFLCILKKCLVVAIND